MCLPRVFRDQPRQQNDCKQHRKGLPNASSSIQKHRGKSQFRRLTTQRTVIYVVLLTFVNAILDFLAFLTLAIFLSFLEIHRFSPVFVNFLGILELARRSW